MVFVRLIVREKCFDHTLYHLQHKERTMKNNSFKRLWGVVLGLALLAAVPFAAQAQAEATPEKMIKIQIADTCISIKHHTAHCLWARPCANFKLNEAYYI